MTRKPRSPRAVAIIDQLQAADRDACEQLRALVEHLGGVRMLDSTAGPAQAIVRRFVTRIVVDGVTLCPDLRLDAPSPTYWAPWAPGRLRCAHCHADAGVRFQTTAKSRRCDVCGVDRG